MNQTLKQRKVLATGQKTAKFSDFVSSDTMLKLADLQQQIHTLLIMEGRILLAAFQQLPSLDDDHRIFGSAQCIKVGPRHTGAGIIGTAAHRGMVTRNCDLYVRSFPCVVCANLFSYTGIKRLYYEQGTLHSVGEGAEMLKTSGVEIFHIR
ncbi:MAG TPA: hypothetical protein VJI70_00810 [Candidatus Paceibacterota bacterium]